MHRIIFIRKSGADRPLTAAINAEAIKLYSSLLWSNISQYSKSSGDGAIRTMAKLHLYKPHLPVVPTFDSTEKKKPLKRQAL